MIDEKIMIGNWFYSAEHGLPFQWSADDFKEIYNSKAKPIELSEDILIKCGFKNDGTYMVFDWLRWCNGFIQVDYGDDEGYWIQMVGYYKYLHQLQNLFYCLSGKELEITL